ncbi:MAG: patatin family protein [Firmicutes bacterium]|nr:patatin family protein [Bacillota bacterium]
MYRAGLVLEGGAMKGVYTAGVLDFFLDAGIDFEKCYGVSAGACCMCSYLSKQRGRALATMTDYLNDKDYWGLSSFLRTGDLFNVQMCYHDIPEKLNLFDYEAFDKNPSRGYAVVTNIETGFAEYIPLQEMHRDIEAVRASASMPFVSRNVDIGGKMYLDGGLADSIPILHAVTDGCRKNVVVMTKEEGYWRSPIRHAGAARLKYAKYPKVYELIKNRHNTYNETLRYIYEQVEEGTVFLIQPRYKSDVSRTEKDASKLRALYEEGYEEAASRKEELLAFLGEG